MQIQQKDLVTLKRQYINFPIIKEDKTEILVIERIKRAADQA